MNEPVAVVEPSTPSPIAPPEPEPTIAAHEAALEALTHDDTPPVRHRATGQMARVDDVPLINSLRKELGDLEREFDLKQAEGESPRVWGLRRQVALGKLAKAAKEKPAPPEPVAASPPTRVSAAPVTQAPSASATGFTETEPTLAQFDASEDPYAAYMRALARYDRRKEVFEEQRQSAQQAAEQQATTTKAQQEAEWQRVHTAHIERVRAFESTQTDYGKTITDGLPYNLANLLQASIILSDNGPAIMLYLATHPDIRDEMHLFSDGKPWTDDNVAIVQRLLTTRMQAASTPSAATKSAAVPVLPKPPNGVRTGPQTPSDEPPGDDAGLAAHERYYGPQSPRRR